MASTAQVTGFAHQQEGPTCLRRLLPRQCKTQLETFYNSLFKECLHEPKKSYNLLCDILKYFDIST